MSPWGVAPGHLFHGEEPKIDAQHSLGDSILKFPARQSRNRTGNTPHPACGHSPPSSDEGRGQGEGCCRTLCHQCANLHHCSTAVFPALIPRCRQHPARQLPQTFRQLERLLQTCAGVRRLESGLRESGWMCFQRRLLSRHQCVGSFVGKPTNPAMIRRLP